MYETNYKIGMFHLSRGNLWDAAFRFKIIKKFWPDKLEPQYQYAYCLVLQNMNGCAIQLLNEILEKDPNYTEARELLNKINNDESSEIIKEFKEKLNKSENSNKE
jgi:hypothetical protein